MENSSDMARIHLTYVHVTKCTNTNQYKVYYAVTAKSGSTIASATVTGPDAHGVATVDIVLNATSNSGVIVLEGAVSVPNTVSFINIRLDGADALRPYFGCKVNMGFYGANDLDECGAGNLMADRPYIASASTDDTELLFDRNVLIYEQTFKHEVSAVVKNGKSIDVTLSTADNPSGHWQIFAIDQVEGAVSGDSFTATITGDPTKKKKTKIPVTGHVINPRQ